MDKTYKIIGFSGDNGKEITLTRTGRDSADRSADLMRQSGFVIVGVYPVD